MYEDEEDIQHEQKETKEIKEEKEEQKKLICIDNNINGKMMTSEQKFISIPCNLNEIIHQYTQDTKELSEITMSMTSNTLPMIIQSVIAPIKIQIKTHKEEVKQCLRKRFEKGMIEEFYNCNTCNMKFICSHCKDICHKGHDIVFFIRLNCSSSVCYCSKCPGKCKCLN